MNLRYKNHSANTNTNSDRRRKRFLLLIITVVLLTMLLLTGYWLFFHKRNTISPPDFPNPIEKTNPAGDKSTIKDNGTPVPNQNVMKQTGENNPVLPVKVQVSDVYQQNDQLRARAAITAPTGGTCNFTFSSVDAKPVVRDVKSVGSAGPQACSVNIPNAEFNKLGTWRLVVTFTGTNGATRQDAKDVSINQ